MEHKQVIHISMNCQSVPNDYNTASAVDNKFVNYLSKEQPDSSISLLYNATTGVYSVNIWIPVSDSTELKQVYNRYLKFSDIMGPYTESPQFRFKAIGDPKTYVEPVA